MKPPSEEETTVLPEPVEKRRELHTLIGGVRIIDLIGEGGCAMVFAGVRVRDGKRVAVKLLHRQLVGAPGMVDRFLREAQTINELRHPNIVELYDLGIDPDGCPYYTMELLDGHTLTELVRRQGRLSPGEVLAIMEPVCAALEAAHSAGIVHRDVKASNIFIVNADRERRIKLLDFGIAKFMARDGRGGLTTKGQRLGSPNNMAPEQIRGGVIDARTDIYALGAVTFQLLTGRTVFHSRDLKELERLHLEAPPTRPSTIAPISPGLETVVLRALEKQPECRFPSVPAFIAALREVIAAPQSPASSRALVLQVRLTGAADGDDEELDAFGAVLDATETTLVALGYELGVTTMDTVVAVRRLVAPDDESEERQRATEHQAAVAEAIAREMSGDRRLSAAIGFAVGDVPIRDGRLCLVLPDIDSADVVHVPVTGPVLRAPSGSGGG